MALNDRLLGLICKLAFTSFLSLFINLQLTNCGNTTCMFLSYFCLRLLSSVGSSSQCKDPWAARIDLVYLIGVLNRVPNIHLATSVCNAYVY